MTIPSSSPIPEGRYEPPSLSPSPSRHSSSQNVTERTESPQACEPPTLGRKSVILIFIGLILAIFVSALDETIVATAAVNITSDFNSYELYSWVPVAYLVTINAVQPIYGKLSDIFGRRLVLLFGLSIFLIGSIGCGWAPSMIFFIAARAVSGIGAGGLINMAYIVVADLFSLEEGPKYRGLLSLGFAFSNVLGPILGGVFSSQTTWRWCFWINIPLVSITILAIGVFLRLPRRAHAGYRTEMKRLDVLGALFMVASIACFVLPVSLAGSYWAWNAPVTIALFVVSAVSLALYFVVEFYVAKEPIIPLRLMKNGGLVATWMTLFFYGMTFITYLYYIPMWSQVVDHRTAVIAGVLLIPLLGTFTSASLIFGPAMKVASRFRWRPTRTMLLIGVLVHLLGAFLIGFVFAPGRHVAAEIIVLMVYGAGCGFTIQSSFLDAQTCVRPDDIAMSSSVAVLFQNIGSTAGLAAAGAINRAHLSRAFAGISEDIISQDTLSRILSNADLVNEPGLLSDAARELVRTKFSDSIQLVLRVAIAFAGMAGLVALLPRQPYTAGGDKEHESANEQRTSRTTEKEGQEVEEGQSAEKGPRQDADREA
ncbi:major facilitator superfamily domain-containing protein [Schizophyllum commune]